MTRPTAPLSPTRLPRLRRWISRRGILTAQVFLAGLTLCILYRQTSVMDTQARISATALAPNVVADAKWPGRTDYISLVFRNIGRSSALQLEISAHAIWEQPPQPNFDPSKSCVGKLQPTPAIGELAEGATAQFTFTSSAPSAGEALYLCGTYEYGSWLPYASREKRTFCFVARDNGTVEPCGTTHIVAIRATIATKRAEVSTHAVTTKQP